MSNQVLIRFWSKVTNPGNWDETECFIWNSNVDKNGYGRFYYNYKEYKAHRFIYERYIGPIPDGMLVCHQCNITSCVNPKHLYLDSHKGNMEYMSKCGRNGNSILRIIDVLTILENIDNGIYTSVTQIMNDYGVSRGTIHCILSGDLWRPVTIDHYSDLDLKRLSKKVKRIQRTHSDFTQSEIDDITNRVVNNGQSISSVARLYRTNRRIIHNIINTHNSRIMI
jgi:hypothetical protein